MTTHVVSDDLLGKINRRWWEVQRRVMEGTIDSDLVAHNLQATIEGVRVDMANRYVDEEMESTFTYPNGYAVDLIHYQIAKIELLFDLNPHPAFKLCKSLPKLPEGAEGWFAVPRWQAVADTYGEAVEFVLAKLGKKRTFYNSCRDRLSEAYLRQSKQTIRFETQLAEAQDSNILIIPAQFGMRHRGRSVRRARVCFAQNEYGLGVFAVGAMLLTHPKREMVVEQLHVDCAGDEYSRNADGDFSNSQIFGWGITKLWLYHDEIGIASEKFGSVSAFGPQSN